MPAWQNFSALTVAPPEPALVKPRLSLTSDILSYRMCGRQYGFFGNDGFVPARTVQIFYGTIIHQVLDRAHRHYSGLMTGVPRGTFPTDADIAQYFQEVENALRAHGMRGDTNRDQALRVIQAFNRIEGPTLYPRVFDTEYRLEADQQDYILRGVVDVLADAGARGPGDREIWDYKGTLMPPLSSQALQDYIWQMCVYAELYRVKTGVYPARAILYFLNELDSKPPAPPVTSRPPRAVYEVNFTPTLIREAMDAFNLTAQDIITCKNTQQWPLPANTPPTETCNACDIRWSCSAVTYTQRFPI
jgi:hypothetical protein